MENRMDGQDRKFAVVFDALRQLMTADTKRRCKPPIGYHTEDASQKRAKRR